MGLNKAGTRLVTGSYDRTAKVWDTSSCQCVATLEGHQNVVFCVALNNPYGYGTEGGRGVISNGHGLIQ